MDKPKTQKYRGLRTVASILLNLSGILSANYIVFYILDHFNPGLHYVIYSTFPLTEYLHLIIPALMLITGILYLILFHKRGFKGYRFSKKRLIGILIADVLIAGAFAMTVNTYTFDWLHIREIRQDQIVAIATMPPKTEETPEPTEEVVELPSEEPTEQTADASAEPNDTPEATPEPTAEPTPIPGLLGDRYKEKFSEGETVVEEPNTSETLADGTVRTLIYVVRGQKSAIELYHYQKDKLEYQIADVYVREIEKLTTESVTNQSYAKMVYDYARELNARIAINSDYFTTNAINEGLIIRNGMLLQSKPCKNSDLCVVFQDGTVRCYDCKKEKIDNDEIGDGLGLEIADRVRRVLLRLVELLLPRLDLLLELGRALDGVAALDGLHARLETGELLGLLGRERRGERGGVGLDERRADLRDELLRRRVARRAEASSG